MTTCLDGYHVVRKSLHVFDVPTNTQFPSQRNISKFGDRENLKGLFLAKQIVVEVCGTTIKSVYSQTCKLSTGEGGGGS